MKKTGRFFPGLFIISLLLSCGAPEKSVEKQSIHIIPKPLELAAKEGSFSIDRKTTIFASEEEGTLKVANQLADLLNDITGLMPEVVSGKPENENSMFLTVNREIPNPEGYVLKVAENGISIEGGSPSGVFYGIQTLRQIELCRRERAVSVALAGFSNQGGYHSI